MSTISGRVAVVTGAGSGIGRALALELARRGAKLALSDVNEDGVAETASQAKALGSADVVSGKLDVSDRQAFFAYADEVVSHFGVVNQIYNNAGIAFSRTVLESEMEDYDRVFSINLLGVITGTKAFLPHLIASGAGHVVNVSSLNGIMAQPEMSQYCAAKYAVRGFTETLRMEMLMARTPVQVTVVHPGGVKTNIATAAAEAQLAREGDDDPELRATADARTKLYNEKFLKMPASKAAEIILRGVEKNKARVVVGNDARALDLLVRAAPTRYQAEVTKALRRMYR
ncbi:MAG: SDR family NAD(P)-dependent oxidoreductase [Solirubrobacteraceae bacterium]|nr:SDR family NAD(P)-dependent oxidoreductase [Patulibacter sp.]